MKEINFGESSQFTESVQSNIKSYKKFFLLDKFKVKTQKKSNFTRLKKCLFLYFFKNKTCQPPSCCIAI